MIHWRAAARLRSGVSLAARLRNAPVAGNTVDLFLYKLCRPAGNASHGRFQTMTGSQAALRSSRYVPGGRFPVQSCQGPEPAWPWECIVPTSPELPFPDKSLTTDLLGAVRTFQDLTFLQLLTNMSSHSVTTPTLQPRDRVGRGLGRMCQPHAPFHPIPCWNRSAAVRQQQTPTPLP